MSVCRFEVAASCDSDSGQSIIAGGPAGLQGALLQSADIWGIAVPKHCQEKKRYDINCSVILANAVDFFDVRDMAITMCRCRWHMFDPNCNVPWSEKLPNYHAVSVPVRHKQWPLLTAVVDASPDEMQIQRRGTSQDWPVWPRRDIICVKYARRSTGTDGWTRRDTSAAEAGFVAMSTWWQPETPDYETKKLLVPKRSRVMSPNLSSASYDLDLDLWPLPPQLDRLPREPRVPICIKVDSLIFKIQCSRVW